MSGKRLFDIVFSLLMLIIALPVMLLVAICIKLSSPGPILYLSERAGKNFKKFTMYKFRSMVVNNGAADHITKRDDARIYPLGKVLRLTKLDELPQLFNILKGDMSIVGPRPEDYDYVIRNFTGPYRNLVSVTPGLTSPASLFDYTHGERATSVDEYVDRYLPVKRNMDLYYIQHWSFLYDAKLILKTAWIILCVVFGKRRFHYPAEYWALYS